jgi:hypothetical protein
MQAFVYAETDTDVTLAVCATGRRFVAARSERRPNEAPLRDFLHQRGAGAGKPCTEIPDWDFENLDERPKRHGEQLCRKSASKVERRATPGLLHGAVPVL